MQTSHVQTMLKLNLNAGFTCIDYMFCKTASSSQCRSCSLYTMSLCVCRPPCMDVRRYRKWRNNNSELYLVFVFILKLKGIDCVVSFTVEACYISLGGPCSQRHFTHQVEALHNFMYGFLIDVVLSLNCSVLCHVSCVPRAEQLLLLHRLMGILIKYQMVRPTQSTCCLSTHPRYNFQTDMNRSLRREGYSRNLNSKVEYFAPDLKQAASWCSN